MPKLSLASFAPYSLASKKLASNTAPSRRCGARSTCIWNLLDLLRFLLQEQPRSAEFGIYSCSEITLQLLLVRALLLLTMVHVFFFPSLIVELLCYMGFCHAFSLSVHMFLLRI